jgi:hypothetical protein
MNTCRKQEPQLHSFTPPPSNKKAEGTPLNKNGGREPRAGLDAWDKKNHFPLPEVEPRFRPVD